LCRLSRPCRLGGRGFVGSALKKDTSRSGGEMMPSREKLGWGGGAGRSARVKRCRVEGGVGNGTRGGFGALCVSMDDRDEQWSSLSGLALGSGRWRLDDRRFSLPRGNVRHDGSINVRARMSAFVRFCFQHKHTVRILYERLYQSLLVHGRNRTVLMCSAQGTRNRMVADGMDKGGKSVTTGLRDAT